MFVLTRETMRVVMLMFYVMMSAKSSDDIAGRIVRSMVIRVPDSCQHADAVIGDVCVHDLICSHVDLKNVESLLSAQQTVTLKMNNVHVTCVGRYSYTLGSSRGDLHAAVDVNSVYLDIKVEQNITDSYPAAITVPRCDLSNVQLKLTFSGGISAYVLSTISPIVNQMVKGAIEKQACPQLSSAIASDGTDALQISIYPFLQNLIDAGVPDVINPLAQPKLYVDWAESLVAGLNQFVFSNWTQEVVQCFSGLPMFFPLGHLMGHLLYNEEHAYVVTISGTVLSPVPSLHLFGNVSAALQSIELSGLENVVASNAFGPSPTERLALLSSLSCPFIQVDIALLLVDDVSGEIISDRCTLSVHLADVAVDVEILVGAVVKRVNAIKLENIADLKHWLDTIDFVNTTSVALNLSQHSISVRTSTADGDSDGSLDASVLQAVDRFAQLVTAEYGGLLIDAAMAFAQGYLRRVLNRSIHILLAKAKAMTTTTTSDKEELEAATLGDGTPAVDPSLIAWSNFRPLQAIHKVLYALPILDMNRLVSCFPKPARNNSDEQQQLQLAGIDTLFDFAFLDPASTPGSEDSLSKAQDLVSHVGVGACLNASSGRDCRPVVVTYRSGIGAGETVASLALRNFKMNFDMLVKLGAKAFKGLTLVDLAQPACLLPWFQGLAVDSLDMWASDVSVSFGSAETAIAFDADITPISEDLFAAVGSHGVLAQINHLIGQWKATTQQRCTSPAVPHNIQPSPDNSVRAGASGSTALTVMWASIWSLALVVFFAAVRWYQWRRGSAALASQVVAYRYALAEDGPRFPVPAGAAAAGSGGNSGVCDEEEALAQEHGHSHDHDHDDLHLAVKHIMGSPGPSLPGKGKGGGNGNGSGKHNGSVARRGAQDWSLVPSPSATAAPGIRVNLLSLIWFLADALIPTAIVGNVALFLYSNMSTEAVAVIAQLGYQMYWTLPEPVFAFGLVTTVGAMLEAQVIMLALLIALFSGIWPYVKLVGLLVCWVCAPQFPDSRGLRVRAGSMAGAREEGLHRFLNAMQALGKWSLVDFYVMVILMSAFAAEQTLAVVDHSPVVGSIYVQPNPGFYAFLVATLGSHILSHILCARIPAAAQTCHNLPLHSSSFAVTLPGASEFAVRSRRLAARAAKKFRGVDDLADGSAAPVVVLRISRWGVASFISLVLATAGCIIVGTRVEAFQFTFFGLSQQALDGSVVTKSLSFIDVGRLIQEASGLPRGDRGVAFMQACFFVFGLFAPLLTLAALAVLWLLPLPSHISKSVQCFVLTLDAWSALDVYCISVAASLVEIRQFVGFIVEKVCDKRMHALLAQITMKDGPCFDVTCSFYLNYWILVAAVLSLHALVAVTSAVARASAERPHRSPSRSFSLRQRAPTQDKGGAGSPSIPPKNASGDPDFDLDLVQEEEKRVPLISAAHLLSDKDMDEQEYEQHATGDGAGDSERGALGHSHSRSLHPAEAVPAPADAPPPPKQQERAQGQDAPLRSKDRGETVERCTSCVLEMLCALRILTIADVEK